MKRFFQIIIAVFIAIFSFSGTFAQENLGITFSIMSKDKKAVTRNTQDQKVLNFYVTGLNNNEDVDVFIAKFKKMDFVVDITISYDLFYSRRIGSATFKSDATQIDIKNALLNSGVTQVIIYEKQININNLLIEDEQANVEKNTNK